MLFFDDEFRNIEDLERLGVVSVFVRHGMTMKLLLDGLHKFSERKSPNYVPRKRYIHRNNPFFTNNNKQIINLINFLKLKNYKIKF